MGETASNTLNIGDNKRNVEWLLKQILNAFELIQHRFNLDSTCFNTVKRGRGQKDSTSLFRQQTRTDQVKAICPSLRVAGKKDVLLWHSRPVDVVHPKSSQ